MGSHHGYSGLVWLRGFRLRGLGDALRVPGGALSSVVLWWHALRRRVRPCVLRAVDVSVARAAHPGQGPARVGRSARSPTGRGGRRGHAALRLGRGYAGLALVGVSSVPSPGKVFLSVLGGSVNAPKETSLWTVSLTTDAIFVIGER